MPELSSAAARLKFARQRAGFRSARRFAQSIGVDETTYRSHEAPPGAPGARAFNEERAQLYADALGVKWMWLLYGEAVAPMSGAAVEADMRVVTEAQALAALKPILAALGVDEGAARPAARGFLRAIRAVQALDRARLREEDFEIAGSFAAQETARDYKKNG